MLAILGKQTNALLAPPLAPQPAKLTSIAILPKLAKIKKLTVRHALPVMNARPVLAPPAFAPLNAPRRLIVQQENIATPLNSAKTKRPLDSPAPKQLNVHQTFAQEISANVPKIPAAAQRNFAIKIKLAP